jgi:ABC-type multidrug transport system fused ATPase/permease subunit
MVQRLRDGAYRALITQEMGWLDTQNIGELTSRLNSDSNTVANTLGLNVNILLRNALQVIHSD